MCNLNKKDIDKQKKLAFQESAQIVIKVGSRLLLDDDGGGINIPALEKLVSEIAKIRSAGKQVILVSSGAVAAGMASLDLTKRPRDMASLQACASIGQGKLMNLYESACQKHGFHTGQLLLSADDLRSRKRYLNLRNCLKALLANGALPIINENDSLSIEEICFGDNDRLAALVTLMSGSQLCLLMTSENGLRKRLSTEMLGERIPLVEKLSEKILGQALSEGANPYSTGGMQSKLEAVRIITSSGEAAWIADGRDFSVLSDIGSGKDCGTLFLPGSKSLKNRQRYLAWFTKSRGALTVDNGAMLALNKGKSLLSKGICKCEGDFSRGDTVEILNELNELIARGIVNYNSADLSLLCGRHSDEFEKILNGKALYDEVVHRNNMSLVNLADATSSEPVVPENLKS